MTTWHDLLYPGDATDFFNRLSFSSASLPFNPHAIGYNRDNARWLMELSRLVYRHDIEEDDPPPQPDRTSLLAKGNFRQRRFFQSEETNTQAILVESIIDPVYAVLVFRGTEQNGGDYKTDIKLWKNFRIALNNVIPLQENHGIDIHEGFQKALDSIWNDIKTEFTVLKYPLFYTGHSLGAALATLAATYYAPTAVYAFGSPRVGNQAFAKSFPNIPVYRVVDDEDSVTTLPPSMLGFTHVGEEQKLVAPPEKHSLFERLKICFTHPPKPLADHAPINYIDRI